VIDTTVNQHRKTHTWLKRETKANNNHHKNKNDQHGPYEQWELIIEQHLGAIQPKDLNMIAKVG
jgi:hypothetical protein